MRHFSHLLMGAAAAVALMAAAAPASATDFVTNTAMNSPFTVHIVPTGENVQMAPMQFTLSDLTTLTVWCTDVLHHITLGNQSPPLQYNESLLDTSTSFSGNPTFSSTQIGEISYLINVLAPGLSGPNVNYVQGAIWDVILGGVGNVTSSDPTVQAGIDGYASLGLQSSSPLVATQSNDGHQGFVFGIPEPATWALMIGGFGLAGAALRRNRHQATLAV